MRCRCWPQPLARNFLSNAAVSDRLFSLFVFVHLGVALLLVFALWFHIQRITRAAVFPPRALALGTLATLLALSLAVPVAGQGPADLAQVPAMLSLDWIVLFVHPLMYATSAGFTWALAAGSFTALLVLPFLPAPARAPVAVVDPANCNGCRRCFADCPYAAITMVPHPDGHPGRELARVDADLCAGCGICAGSCPSSTPFRSTTALVTGIDMPQLPIDALRAQVRGAVESATRATTGGRLRLRPGRRHRHAHGSRRACDAAHLHRSVATLVRRVRAARGGGWRAGGELPRRRVRVPPRRALDRRAPVRRTRAAPARQRAARSGVAHRGGRRRGGQPSRRAGDVPATPVRVGGARRVDAEQRR